MASLTLNGSTSGAVTLQPPAVAGTNTITLPAATGTVALTASPTFTGTLTVPTINAGSATALTLQSNGTTGLYIDTSQNVGIGTTSPSTTLTVNGSAQIVSTAYNSGGITLGTTVSSVDWRIADSGASTYALTFGSVSGGTTTERMRIDSSGNVGIGTSSPGYKLDVNGTINSTSYNFGSSNNLLYQSSAQTATLRAGAGQAYFSFTYASGNMLFDAPSGTMTLGTSGTERMRIDSSGNVGIGTTSPAQKLDVNGEGVIYGNRIGRGAGAVASNTVFGYQALNSNSTGSQQTVIGYQAGYSMSTTSNLVAVGYQAGYNLTGGDSVLLGTQAGYSLSTAFNSVAIGHQALYSCSTSADNVCIGAYAGKSLTSYSNVLIGFQAGFNSVAYTTGNNNIVIGWNSRGSAAGNTNEIVIGSNIAGKGTNTGFINAGGGGNYQGNNSASWSTTSDQRIKENVNPIYSALATLQKLNPVTFDYILSQKSDVGFIAQEYQKVLPEQVHEHSASEEEKELTGSDTLYGITPNLVPYLVAAIQELKAEIDTLKSKVGA